MSPCYSRRSLRHTHSVRSLCVLAFALVGCASSERSRVEIEGLDLDYGFLVIIDDQGNVTRVIPPFGVAGGELSFGALPAITLVGNEEKFVLVGLEKLSLQKTFQGFEPARERELFADEGAP